MRESGAGLAREAKHAFVGLRDRVELLPGEPAQRERLVARAKCLAAARDEQDAHVVMLVRGLRAERGNGMDVDVEQHVAARVGDELEVLHPRFLARLAKRTRDDVRVAIRVAAELKPAAELPVVREQEPLAVLARDPRRRSDVSRQAAALEARARLLDERASAKRAGLVGMARRIAREHVEQRLAMHGRHRSNGARRSAPARC